jgi:hypothetical protein
MDRPLELQEFEALRFPDNQHLRLARLPGKGTGCIYPSREVFLVLISVADRKY